MSDAISIDDLLKMEQECRRGDKWLVYQGPVKADNGKVLEVGIKQHGFYSQILRIGDDGINYAAGHIYEGKGPGRGVKALQAFIRKEINEVAAK